MHTVGALVFIGLMVVLFGGIQTVQDQSTILVGFEDKPDGEIECYIAVEIEGDFNGLRFPTYPVARIDMERDERWFFIRGKRGNSSPLARLNSTDSITVRVQDGVGETASGHVWDFPPLHERQAKTIEPGSMADDVMQGMSAEMQETLKAIFTGIPEAGEPIPSPRKERMIQLMINTLVDAGHTELGLSIQNRTASHSYIDWKGWFLLGGLVVIIVIFVVAFDMLQSRSDRRRRAF